jgi:alkylation response protein AidB-like acyl-CoA dehydrogenase
MRQPGVQVRPIRQMTGTWEFNEVLFDGARTPHDWVVGGVNGGWRVAMGTLDFERSRRLATFPILEAEFLGVVEAVREQGRSDDPLVRDELAKLYSELMVMRTMNLRTLGALAESKPVGAEASVGKLYWSLWHQRLTRLGVDVLGLSGEILAGAPYRLSASQHAFLYSRAETIFAGSNEIQRNIIAERVLGLPRR